MSDVLSAPSWTHSQRILFRFFFLYFLLFIIIQNNGAFPYWGVLMKYPTEGLHILLPWIGKHILQLPKDITVFTNGSGDTTYDYVIVFFAASIALIGCVVWTIVDRSRTSYNTLYYWLMVIVRFYVGLMLIHYGLVKVFKLQFPGPGAYRLTQFYGDSSPMGLAWTFLGFSKGYNLFMGLAEVAAVLLLFRRTMTLGAILTLMTTANVMAVNYFYDVPVKILSTHLVVMTIFILLYDAKNLWQFFVGRKSVKLGIQELPLFQKKVPKIGRIVFKVLLIGNSLIIGGWQTYKMYQQYGDDAPPSKLSGIFQVERFLLNNDTLPPLVTDTVRWRQLFIEYDIVARVRMMNDSVNRFRFSIDSAATEMHFVHRNNDSIRFDFKYAWPSAELLELKGRHRNDSIYMLLKLNRDLKGNFRLTKRGFHWVNEFPYNR